MRNEITDRQEQGVSNLGQSGPTPVTSGERFPLNLFAPLEPSMLDPRVTHALPPGMEPHVVAMFRNRSAQFAEVLRLQAKVAGAWRSMTWKQHQAVVNRVIGGLTELGVHSGARVGILSDTRWEWLVADWAILGMGAVTIPLYPTLTPATIEYMLNDSQVEYIFVENAAQYEKIAQVRANLPGLRHVIMLDDIAAVTANTNAISFEKLLTLSTNTSEQANELAEHYASAIRPEDVASIIYTSGTTKRPKGVIHTHASIMAQVRCTGAALTTFRPGMRNLLWLPLAHVLGREEHLLAVDRGGVTIVADSVISLAHDITDRKPHIIVGVPRLYEKAYAGIQSRVEAGGALQRRIFQWASGVGSEVVELRQRRAPIPQTLQWRYTIADRLVFHKVREALGGQIEFSITGGAPIDRELLRFFHAAGILILEGWGLTETMGALTVNRVENYRLGSVGIPTTEHQVRIADDGEVLVHGPCVFMGYQNNPAEDAAALDSERWLHTGDLGSLDADGFLRIVGRKKELIITSAGKKIVPDPVETLLRSISTVAHAVVYGEQKPYTVALLTLDHEALRAWASSRGVAWTNADQVAASKEYRRYLDEAIAAVNTQLARYETVKQYAIIPGEFTIENGLLTPTLKVRRNIVYQLYRSDIEQLYTEAAQSRAG